MICKPTVLICLLASSILVEGDELADLRGQLLKVQSQLTDEIYSLKQHVRSLIGGDESDGCGDDWISYSNTKCFKVLASIGNFWEALGNCTQLDISSTPITVESCEEQKFVNRLINKYNNISSGVWIGFYFTDHPFKWDDDSEVQYTNWGHNAPGHHLGVRISTSQSDLGQWIDVSYHDEFLIACQKSKIAKRTLVERLNNLQDVIDEQQAEIVKQNTVNAGQQEQIVNLTNKLKSNEIPIGFIYTQLPDQEQPSAVWPQFSWQDVTAHYAGLFFRAEGGNSASFGTVQAENIPQITGIRHEFRAMSQKRDYIKLDKEVSEPYFKGRYYGSEGHGMEAMLIEKSFGEVRPRNSAIRIWKRA